MTEINPPKAPLFRDPIHDGAADPTIIWNHEEESWWLLYTNRRAYAPGSGQGWVHGTDIGIASSTDGGQNWLYRGIIPDLEFERGRNTFWAPEVIYHEGIYHMYVSYVRGIPIDWNHDREIVHYTSKNLWDWDFQSVLKLSSERVIDAGVYKLPDGKWRLVYKDECNKSHTYAAESDDLYNWEVVGPIITDCPHEGPNVFFWKEKYWLITDFWKGLGVYSSVDGINWVRQKDILDTPGKREDDNSYGHHADILVQEERAYIFYFTHPERVPGMVNPNDSGYRQRRSSIQVAELELLNNKLLCDRDKVFDFYLKPGIFKNNIVV